MIREACDSDLFDIEKFIGDEYYKCLYLFLDLKKYGLTNNSNVKAWIQENKEKEMQSIIMQYYSGMHIFSKNPNYNILEMINIIEENKPTMICAEKTTIENLYMKISTIDSYNVEYGYVRRLLNLKIEKSKIVEKAKKDDFYGIAKLLYEDEDIGSSYKLDELTKQMIARYEEGYSRNYIIKKDYEILAHASTGAEYKNIAIMNYVVTNKNYRKQGLATKVCATLCADLLSENKEIYLINYSNESTKLYDKLGFEVSCDWGKLYKNLKEGEK